MIYNVNETFFIINESFLDEYNNWNKIDNHGYFTLAETSNALEKIGLKKQNIVIDKSKLLRIKHEISKKKIKNVKNKKNKKIILLKSQEL